MIPKLKPISATRIRNRITAHCELSVMNQKFNLTYDIEEQNDGKWIARRISGVILGVHRSEVINQVLKDETKKEILSVMK